MLINYDCKHFKGYIPCKPNKTKNYVCSHCPDYSPISKKILIIKLGALGDVIRTTPLVPKYHSLYPNCHISWITLTPDILPHDEIDTIYKWDSTSLFILTQEAFDIAINLDKDKEACMLLTQVQAKKKYGFFWKDNHIAPVDAAAEHKLLTGLFDSLSKNNKQSYLEEIFEIVHQKFQHEPYLIRRHAESTQKWQQEVQKIAKSKKVVGLNTGCGARWTTRLWPTEYWGALIQKLEQKGYCCILLGGEQEDAQNKIYAQTTAAHYFGHSSLHSFIELINACDIIITQVSMSLHIATALGKKIVLMNNIFNKYEFELYGRGSIVEPSTGCDCYYGTRCSRSRNCAHDIHVEAVYEATIAL
ncbi:MAG: glycosyltransferase family 9 protein [Phycisphaerales bacterium]|nr:glycosyltransferase family 9 protein [Phycisphaerales bacterium]